MLTFWSIIAAATIYGGTPTVGGLWMFERWRSRRRNRSGLCATCGTSWQATGSGEPYLIHGRLVCERCADVGRRRMPWHFGILAGATAAVAFGIAWNEGGFVPGILFPVGTTLAMTLGAVQLMKFANRRAQRRIAAGEFPDLHAPDREDRWRLRRGSDRIPLVASHLREEWNHDANGPAVDASLLSASLEPNVGASCTGCGDRRRTEVSAAAGVQRRPLG
ncbi:MAG: hypothetical protein ACPHQP_03225 [Longimicrobiales bacterium]